MGDLHSLKRPLAQKFTKKNDIHPFEDPSSLEFFAEKNDCSLMVFGSHSKKRPHTVTFVRFFDHKVLEMLELHVDVDTFRTISQFKSAKARVGLKPLVSFSGTAFDSPVANTYTMAKSLLLDFFKGEDTNNVDVEGLQYMVHISVPEEEDAQPAPKICLRTFMISTKKSGQSLPRVEVEEMGPRVDFRVGRVKEADVDMMKAAMKKPKGLEVCCISTFPLTTRVTDKLHTGKKQEEHRNRHHRRQGRPHPSRQARTQRHANEKDEGSQEKQRRRRWHRRPRCFRRRRRGCRTRWWC
jgi:ribosome production factor 2